MKRLMSLFKKTHEKNVEQIYPADLEEKYTVTKKTLGVGSFAVVKECIRKSDNKPFALKIILKKVIAGIVSFRRECGNTKEADNRLTSRPFLSGKEHMLTSELGKLSIVHRAYVLLN